MLPREVNPWNGRYCADHRTREIRSRRARTSPWAETDRWSSPWEASKSSSSVDATRRSGRYRRSPVRILAHRANGVRPNSSRGVHCSRARCVMRNTVASCGAIVFLFAVAPRCSKVAKQAPWPARMPSSSSSCAVFSPARSSVRLRTDNRARRWRTLRSQRPRVHALVTDSSGTWKFKRSPRERGKSLRLYRHRERP